jgi:drug/metabolite transporter (DMT)-like permease
MSDQHSNAGHAEHSIKGYLFVFGALLVGTLFTVWASYIDLGHHWHLVSERKMIFTVLGMTVFFFAGLMFLTLWSMQHESLIHWP